MEGVISEHTRLVACKDHLACDLAGEAVILDSKSGLYYSLDPVGARIWNLLQNETTVHKLVNTILEEYEVERARCEADLQNLLKDLATKGLLEIHPES